MTGPAPGRALRLAGSDWRVERLLGKGKAGRSWLVAGAEGRAVLKWMHDEPCPCFEFDGNKVARELRDRDRLASLGIPLPALLAADEDGPWLLREHVDGPTAAEHAAAGRMEEALVRPLYAWSARLRRAGLNLDWFPANFVLEGGDWIYVDGECHPWEERWSFEAWGALYWANGAGLARWLADGDGRHINRPGEGRPLDGPWAETARRWRERWEPREGSEEGRG